MNVPTRVTLIIISTALAAGCSSRVSLQNWQKSLEDYSDTHSGGDMGFLSQAEDARLPASFTVLGGKSPDDSTDVAGILLGRNSIDGANWLIFVVASVKERDIVDIRVAMLSDDGSPRRWLISAENEKAMSAYHRHHDTVWRRLHPGRKEAPISPTLFPPEGDLFRLERAAATVIVIEEHSGVRWTLVMDRQRPAAPNSTRR